MPLAQSSFRVSRRIGCARAAAVGGRSSYTTRTRPAVNSSCRTTTSTRSPHIAAGLRFCSKFVIERDAKTCKPSVPNYQPTKEAFVASTPLRRLLSSGGSSRLAHLRGIPCPIGERLESTLVLNHAYSFLRCSKPLIAMCPHAAATAGGGKNLEERTLRSSETAHGLLGAAAGLLARSR